MLRWGHTGQAEAAGKPKEGEENTWAGAQAHLGGWSPAEQGGCENREWLPCGVRAEECEEGTEGCWGLSPARALPLQMAAQHVL